MLLFFSLARGSAGAFWAAAACGDGPGLDMNRGQFGGSRGGRGGPVRTLIEPFRVFIRPSVFFHSEIQKELQLSEIFPMDLFPCSVSVTVKSTTGSFFEAEILAL